MEQTQLRQIIEGALLAAGQPLNLNRLKALFGEDQAPENEELRAALDDIAADCRERGFELKELGSGWRFQVREELAPWINRLWDEKPPKYSRALLETLALVAYRQPLTRGDIEEVRGVAVSSHIIKTLSEREWIKVVGHRDVPGRPALYATTRQFLDHFNLKSLDELPSLGEIRDLDDINKALDLGGDQPEGNEDESGTERDASDDQTADDTQTEPSSSEADEEASSTESRVDGASDDNTVSEDSESAGEPGAETGAEEGEPEEADRTPAPDGPDETGQNRDAETASPQPTDSQSL